MSNKKEIENIFEVYFIVFMRQFALLLNSLIFCLNLGVFASPACVLQVGDQAIYDITDLASST